MFNYEIARVNSENSIETLNRHNIRIHTVDSDLSKCSIPEVEFAFFIRHFPFRRVQSCGLEDRQTDWLGIFGRTSTHVHIRTHAVESWTVGSV